MSEDLTIASDELFWQTPPSTGNSVVWYMDPAVVPFFYNLHQQMEMARERDDRDRYAELREELMSLPGHPAIQPGDSIELRLRKQLISLPNAPVKPITVLEVLRK